MLSCGDFQAPRSPLGLPFYDFYYMDFLLCTVLNLYVSWASEFPICSAEYHIFCFLAFGIIEVCAD